MAEGRNLFIVFPLAATGLKRKGEKKKRKGRKARRRRVKIAPRGYVSPELGRAHDKKDAGNLKFAR